MSSNRKRVGDSIGAVASGVLNEYFTKVKRKPDAAGLDVLAEVLSLSKTTIFAWFRNKDQT